MTDAQVNLLSQSHNVLARPYAGHWRAACTCGWKADGPKADVIDAKRNHLYGTPRNADAA